MRRGELERLLEQVPDHPAPDPDLEQYRTPAPVAAELLWAAHAAGDVAGRRVLDLGCGTGILGIGAAALGAAQVLGIDVDADAVALARQAAARLLPDGPAGSSGTAARGATGAPGAAAATGAASAPERVAFAVADLADWEPPGRFDTVVMNPPFGAQRANRHGDRVFYARAAQAAPGGAVWFLAPQVSERFLAALAREQGGRLERVLAWDYPLPARFGFHRDVVRTVAVGGYLLRWPATTA